MSINFKKILDFHLTKDRSMECEKRILSDWRGNVLYFSNDWEV